MFITEAFLLTYMSIQNIKKDFEEYLKATRMCDSNHPTIIQKAQELTKNASSDKEKAIKIFYFVRDEIPFLMDPFVKSASNTLKKGYGFCIPKTNLQIALLRALGIPARFHIIYLKKDFLKPLITAKLYSLIPENAENHPYCECYIGERWISCDTLFDKPLLEGAKNKKVISQDLYTQIDWNGENDMFLFSQVTVKDEGILPNLDELWKKFKKKYYSPTILAYLFFMKSNKLMNSLRTK